MYTYTDIKLQNQQDAFSAMFLYVSRNILRLCGERTGEGVVREAVRRALEALESGLTPDAVLTDAEEALDALGELTGRTAREEIVQQIFSRFCVGK